MGKKWKLDLTGTYLLGVSGGCDSMALLDLAYRQGYRIIVALVNYRKRETSELEEKIVRDYCDRRDIPVFFLYPEKKDNDNFQNWAREVRYGFYLDLYEQHECDALLLGHQLDDHIETYLIDKNANRKSNHAGIAWESWIRSMKVLRPLLDLRKRETRQYCIDNLVEFHDDESNFTDDYRRNYIRHHQVETADKQQLKLWLREIDEYNEAYEKDCGYILDNYRIDAEISLKKFRKETHQRRELMIRLMIRTLTDQDRFSSRMIDQIEEILLKADDNGYIDLGEGRQLVYEYGKVYAWCQPQKYSYRLDSLEYIETPYFLLNDHGQRIQGFTVTDDDFPLTIRPYEDGDEIALRFGHKKVSRFMIDRKIPKKNRALWPVVINRKNEVIFVSGIGCDVYHFTIKPNIFMIEYHS